MRIASITSFSLIALTTTAVTAADEISTDFQLRQTSTEASELSEQNSAFSLREYEIEIERHAFLFDADHRSYNWQQATPDSDDLSWNSLTRLAPGVQYFGEVAEDWYLWAQLYAIAGFESSISSSSVTYNPQLIAITPYNDDIMLFAGFGALYHPVDPVYYPILGLAWDAGSQSNWSGALGFPETMISYQLNDRWTMKAEFEVEIRFYKLSESNQSAPGGYLKTEDLIPGLQLEFHPTSSFTSYLGLQYAFERSLTLYDYQRALQEENQVASGWGIRFGIEWSID